MDSPLSCVVSTQLGFPVINPVGPVIKEDCQC